MRISDWSSGVCSSDLPIPSTTPTYTSFTTTNPTTDPGAEHYIIMNDVTKKRWAWNLETSESGADTGSDLILKGYDDNGNLIGDFITVIRNSGRTYLNEIGRASCRERVCQYV